MRGTEITTRVKNYQYSERHRTYYVAVTTFVTRKTPEYPNAEHVTWIQTEAQRLPHRGLDAFRHMLRLTSWFPNQTKKEEEIAEDKEFPPEVISWFQALESKTTKARTVTMPTSQ